MTLWLSEAQDRDDRTKMSRLAASLQRKVFQQVTKRLPRTRRMRSRCILLELRDLEEFVPRRWQI